MADQFLTWFWPSCAISSLAQPATLQQLQLQYLQHRSICTTCNAATLQQSYNSCAPAIPLSEWMLVLSQPHVFGELFKISAMLLHRRPLVQIYPPHNCIFKALTYTIPKDVKCVILCQDPYPRAGQAMGLCLSSMEILQSLERFFKVIYYSYGFEYTKLSQPPTGDLEYLAQQGVLLLNSALTVEDINLPKERRKKHVQDWKPVIVAILTAIYKINPHCAFLAMGTPAKRALLAVAWQFGLVPGFPADGPYPNLPKPFWHVRHPTRWSRIAAQNVFEEVKHYLNGLHGLSQLFFQPQQQWIQDNKGLWQYRIASDYINWMPYLESRIVSTVAPLPNPAYPNQIVTVVVPQQQFPSLVLRTGQTNTSHEELDFAVPDGSGPTDEEYMHDVQLGN